jgi:hypothetical protein
MASTTVTLALEGEDIPAGAYGKAMQAFGALIDALSAEVAAQEEVAWTVVDLQVGSTVTTLGAAYEERGALQRITRAYEDVGIALKNREAIPYSKKVALQARAIASILDGKVGALRFETPEMDIIVADPHKAPKPALIRSYGAIRGRIETLTQRGQLRFTLYDSLNDRAVACYLQEGQEELMRNLWGQRVIVEGIVSRDPDTGRPVAIRSIQNIVPIEDVEPGTFAQARGVWASEPGDLSSAEAIRQIRDA